MLPEIDTARLKLRLARPGMETTMARFLRENFPGHLDRWFPPVPEAYFTESYWGERLAGWVDDYRADRGARFVMQLRSREGGDPPPEAPLVGSCSYTNFVRGAFHACHLGYQVGREYEGRGFMAEALRGCNAFVFGTLRMHRIMANFRPENGRSRALLERLGFTEEGFARQYLFIDGAWRDHVLTALMNPAYDDAWLLAPR
jgi:[ribosomal protein S5]-alanine N-acetyltransferase